MATQADDRTAIAIRHFEADDGLAVRRDADRDVARGDLGRQRLPLCNCQFGDCSWIAGHGCVGTGSTTTATCDSSNYQAGRSKLDPMG